MRLPYGYGIAEPIHVAFDGVNQMAKYDYYYGLNTYLYNLNMTYQVIPRVTTKVCFSAPQQPPVTLQSLLPNITGWAFMGTRIVASTKCFLFQQNVTNFGLTAVYSMFVKVSDNTPVRLEMLGYDFLFGSHPDLYILDYLTFTPTVSPSEFTVPALCNNAKPASFRSQERAKALVGLIGYMTRPTPTDDEFVHFQTIHKRSYGPHEHKAKRTNFHSNKKLIDHHNANHKTHGYKLAMNHFADYKKQEFLDIYMPTIGKARPTRPTTGMAPVTQMLEPTKEMMATLPQSIDWRKKHAVTMVKDQGICGSCWTFGTAGSLEGQWAVAHGTLYELSEQQIVDCSWETWAQGNSGCDGGFAAPAFDWIWQNGGIANERQYPYLMVDSYCDSANVNPQVKLKGYVNVTMGSENALQYAVGTFGPVSVAIDAAHEEFEFYSSGVYYNPKCQSNMDALDHEVLVVGYGNEADQDYWIVKNSWSTHWGDKGYIKMARNRNNNCGIATQATYPLVQ